ncbi:PQQ-dependent sugar dehydrogenase [Lentzea tibetensis]|nr:PQQ-dependent sugar dehydrogenase [Lentzea tibetensis]
MKVRWCWAAVTVTALVLTAAQPAGAAVATAAKKLDVPWGLSFLPDKSALVTERSGRILSIKGTTVTQVGKVAVEPGSESGLLGIAVSPNYNTDKYVYVYHSTDEDNRISRMKLGGTPEPLVTGIPLASVQVGGRLAFGPDGFLYASTGDATNGDDAQDTKTLGGKILRMTKDGKPAPGNPFGNLVYSYGHRNVQGFAWDGQKRMYASELGQQDLDELNRIESGKNYGWPECEGPCSNPKYTKPLLTWPTDQASPSGVAIYKNSIYVAALRGERMWKVPLNANGSVGKPTAVFKGTYGRLRTAVAGPDGKLWITTTNRDGNGGTVRKDDDKVFRTDG